MQDTNDFAPIFIHSLFRSGSTYIFNVFRRSSHQYWCYQEPLNEYITYVNLEPEKLLQIHKQAIEYLRHPELDRPYFYEFHAISKDIGDSFKKNLSYDSYFFPKEDELAALNQYFTCLIAKSQGRPVLQCCRTSGRVKYLKNRFGGMHVFLWRNPWDQWWSYRTGFDANNLWILNSHALPEFLREIKNELDVPEFHDSNLLLEYKFFSSISLSSQDSYKLFYALWCHAMLEALPACNFSINIDMLSRSKNYRAQILNDFSVFGVNSSALDFNDCNVPIGFYGSEDIKFFEPIENSVHSLLIKSGYSQMQIEKLKKIRADNLPEEESPDGVIQAATRDATRARKLARDFQTDLSVFQKPYNISEIEARILEKDVRYLKKKSTELEHVIQSQEVAIQNLEDSLKSIISSRSMRITAPLRLLLNLTRKIKQWIRNQFPKKLKKKIGYKTPLLTGKSFVTKISSLLSRLPKKVLKVALKKVFLLMYGSPQANRIVRSLVRKMPELESILRRIYTKITYSVSGQESYTYSKELSHLSPAARRVYSDLKKAIDKYHGGDN